MELFNRILWLSQKSREREDFWQKEEHIETLKHWRKEGKTFVNEAQRRKVGPPETGIGSEAWIFQNFGLLS
jgi:hypothetical protein